MHNSIDLIVKFLYYYTCGLRMYSMMPDECTFSLYDIGENKKLKNAIVDDGNMLWYVWVYNNCLMKYTRAGDVNEFLNKYLI